MSTIYRELKRNSGSRNHYNWETAEAKARRKKRRTPGNRRISQEVREEALRLLKEKQWSPEQISGYLAKEGKRISTESIYRIIRKDKKEGGSLYKKCRHRLKHRARPVGGKRIVIPNRVSISERPKEVDECDLVILRWIQSLERVIVEQLSHWLKSKQICCL